MRPITRGKRTPDQQFGESERLYKRVPREHLSPEGEIEPSLIQCSFNKDVKSAPSVLRGRYATARDALRPGCADGKDVSSQAVFYLKVSALPKQIISGDHRTYNFYPFHDPEESCYAHTVISCRNAESTERVYVRPTNAVRNAFKAKLVSSLRPAAMLPFPLSLLAELKKSVVALRAPQSRSAAN